MDKIDYSVISDWSSRMIVKNALQSVLDNKGVMLGEHYFCIRFITSHPLSRVPHRLLEKYPEHMDIKLQHQFSNLYVNDDGFRVSLGFDGVDESVFIPFYSLLSFFDPHANYDLRFDPKYSNSYSKFVAEKSHNNTEEEDNVIKIDFSKK